MILDQNETGDCGLRIAECGVKPMRNRDRLFCAHSAFRNPNSAFTLTELLVVITIIAILAGLITGAAINALNKAKQAAITLEIQQLDMAIADFKNEYGAYPPNGMIPVAPESLLNSHGDLIWPIVASDFERMFKKAFPRNDEHEDVIRALAGIAPSGSSPLTSAPLDGGMSAAEAMVFWLGGFSKDPQFPISGPGGPSFADRIDDSDTALNLDDEILEDRNRRYEFDLGRLEPRDANGVFSGRFITYRINEVDHRINFWRYVPNGSEEPLVYFDVSRHKPEEYDMHATGIVSADVPMVHAVEKLREGISGPPGHGDLVFVNQGKFQILHAGIDDAWGSFGPLSLLMQEDNEEAVITFPEGPFIGDIADTVGNFMTGTLEDEQE